MDDIRGFPMGWACASEKKKKGEREKQNQSQDWIIDSTPTQIFLQGEFGELGTFKKCQPLLHVNF